MRAPQNVSRRAASYASAKVRAGVASVQQRASLATGWAEGYRRAMFEVRKILVGSSIPLFELDQLSKPERMK